MIGRTGEMIRAVVDFALNKRLLVLAVALLLFGVGHGFVPPPSRRGLSRRGG